MLQNFLERINTGYNMKKAGLCNPASMWGR